MVALPPVAVPPVAVAVAVAVWAGTSQGIATAVKAKISNKTKNIFFIFLLR
jgi:hypothetical protein